MIRSLLIVVVFLFGCSTTNAPKPEPTKEVSGSSDLYRIMAIDAENRADYLLAAEYYAELFELTKEIGYRKNQVEALLKGRDFDGAIEVSQIELGKKEDRDFRRYETIAYTGKKEFLVAVESGKKMLINETLPQDLILVGDLYYLLDDYKNAENYYKKAYSIEPSEQMVDKIALLLHERLNRTKEAIAYYETHITLYGCSEFICQRVANIYAQNNNVYGVISSYKRIYAATNDEIVAQKIVELYLLVKDYKRLANWLEESRYNDLILLEVYRHQQNLIGASSVALRLYEERGDIEHLALHAMLSYESSDMENRATILQTVKLLERVVAQSENHVYLNYLGYLLIDHGVDVDRGVELVKKALIGDPNNPYYTDSLAWGYYMQGKNSEALKLMESVKKELGDDKTVMEHYEAINQAVKKENR